MRPFKALIEIVGVNPFVRLPETHLEALFAAAGKRTGPLPVAVTVDGHSFSQTLVRYRGLWRLYLNTPMRNAAGKSVGDTVRVTVVLDTEPRREPVPPMLRRALAKNPVAKRAFSALLPSRRKEICRYLNSAKSEVTRSRNVAIVVDHLTGRPARGLKAVLRAK